jgi:hypothetical protein
MGSNISASTTLPDLDIQGVDVQDPDTISLTIAEPDSPASNDSKSGSGTNKKRSAKKIDSPSIARINKSVKRVYNKWDDDISLNKKLDLYDKGDFTDYKEIKMNYGGWDHKLFKTMFFYIQKLKYNRIITNHFLHELKSYEGRWTWIIILISTFTSGISVINNISDEELPYENMKKHVNIVLTVCTLITSLIAAWIKKQQYVSRINELDRYTQKLNKLCEELQFELNKPAKLKKKDCEFTKEYFPQISLFLSTVPSISPYEWKQSVKQISKDYSELLSMDGSESEKIWPWYSVKFIDGKYYRYRTEFGIVKKCLVTRCFYYCIECCCWSMARCIRNCGCRSRTGPEIEMRNRYQEDVLNMNEENYVTDEEMY